MAKASRELRLFYSVFKDLRTSTKAEVVDIGVTEEELSLRPVVSLSDTSSVSLLETYGRQLGRKAEDREIWGQVLSIDEDADYGFDIKLSYFLDGIQRTSWVANVPVLKTGERVPVSVGQVAAAILHRENRHLKIIRKYARNNFSVFLPFEFMGEVTDIEAVRKWVAKGMPTIGNLKWRDTSYDPAPVREGGKVVYDEKGNEKHDRIPTRELRKNLTDINFFRNLSRRWNRRHRAILEQELHDDFARDFSCKKAKEKEHNFLVIDGVITDVRGPVLQFAIGISKSFNTRFLNAKEHNKVLQLKQFQRSPVFLLHSPPDESSLESGTSADDIVRFSGKRASWYVRLRTVKYSSPTYGLVRIELLPDVLPNKGSADLWGEEDTRFVDAITQAVIRERLPTSFPDKRWHNLLYPIFMCEEYLRSMIYPHTTVKYISVTPEV
ncbi:hypothetical protein J7M02_00820 [Candidatus Aerophobetes bacterium]|nr:hypothetical protein [Candidatus Aerophobetes bacterium]